jgi:hypothetical protein
MAQFSEMEDTWDKKRLEEGGVIEYSMLDMLRLRHL